MNAYRGLTSVPALVERAMNLASHMGYQGSCSLETGRLLQLLASQYQSGVIAEIRTGCGVSASWMVSKLSPSTTFFTIEESPAMAAAARALFDPLLNVRVIQGDWQDILRNWRFRLLYAGPDSARLDAAEAMVRALRPGGLIVVDGLAPRERLPKEARKEPEPLREFWLNDPRLIASELQVSPVEAVILATVPE